jgi:predicted ATPase
MAQSITRVRLRDFKNFQDASLKVGRFTVLVGTNASGKSNIRDAFRFLHGIGRGYSLADVIGGRYGPGGQAEWSQMRGAVKEIIRFGQSSFEIEVDIGVDDHQTANSGYAIKVRRMDDDRFRVASESLSYNRETIYTSHPGAGDPVGAQDDDTHLALRMAKTDNQRKFGHKFLARPDQPALTSRMPPALTRTSRGRLWTCSRVSASSTWYPI